jgi:hypothetical protein
MMVRRNLTEFQYYQKIEREHQRAKEHDQLNFDRAMTLWRMYWGVDTDKGLGQIPSAVVTEMIRVGKQPGAYNLARPTVDSIAGGIMMRPFGFAISPVDTEEDSLTYKAKDIQYVEQEVMNWRLHKMEQIIGGLICRSDTEMYIDKKKWGKPYIGRRTRLPGTVIYDPIWKSPVSGDCRKCYVEDYLSPLQMLEMYVGKEREIVNATMRKALLEKIIETWADLQATEGDEYGWNSGIIPYAERDEIWGTLYKVIQCYHVEKVRRKFEYVLTEDGEQMRIPDDLKNAQEKIAWLNENVPGWIPDSVFEDEEEIDVQYMTAICPALAPGLLLCNGPTEVQCGRLQFFPWSAYRSNGEWGGIMDSIKDMQQSINWIQNTLQYRLHVDGDGCSWYVDPAGFKTPQEFKRWKESKNKAGENFELAPGYLARFPNGPAIPVDKSPYPKEAMDRLTHLIEVMWPKISKWTASSRGETEYAGEPAELFKMKKMQNDIERYTIYEGLKNFENEWGEAYLTQMITTHGQELNRTFYNPRTKKQFTINKTERRPLEDGSQVDVIVNNLMRLRDVRHRVVITESDESPTRKIEVMQTANELLKTIDPNRKPVSYQQQAFNLISNTDTFSEDEKMQMEEDHQLEVEAAREQLKAQTLNFKSQSVQAQIDLVKLEGQMLAIKAQQAAMASGNVHPVTGQPMSGVGGVPANAQPMGAMQPQQGGEGRQPMTPQSGNGWVQPISAAPTEREMANA